MNRRRLRGFTLLEILVVLAIAAVSTSMALPTLRSRLLQGQVDRYTKFTEAGLIGLRTRLREQRLSHCLCFVPNIWAAPSAMGLERQQSDGTRSQPLQACRNEDPSPTLRVMNLEGSDSSLQVDVRANTGKFCISPPGTSAAAAKLTLQIRSRQHASNQQLRVRCVEINGNGYLKRGNWSETSNECTQ